MSLRPTQFHDTLRASSHLLESNAESVPERNLKSVLNARLENFYVALNKIRPLQPRDTVESLQLETAQCALQVVEHVQSSLDADVHSTNGASPIDGQAAASCRAPAIGSRDLTQLRTLLAMVFRWGVDLLLARVSNTWSSGIRTTEFSVSHVPEDYRSLSSLSMHLAAILFPRGVHGHLSQTLITASILDYHIVEYFRATMALGWLPKSLCSEHIHAIDELRQVVLRLLDSTPLPQVIADLGAVLSGTPLPAHVRRLCSSLLSKSLLRDRGINALFSAVFREDNLEEPSLEMYEHVGRILMTIPAGKTPEEYFTSTIPRILGVLSEDVPATHKRAASFSFARMLDPGFAHHELISNIALPILHSSLVLSPDVHKGTASPGESSPITKLRPEGSMKPSQALSIIRTLLLNSDPSPVFITLLLSPILPCLYALSYHLDKTKTSDPVLKESVKAMLVTWGKVVETQMGIETLWSVLQSQRISWQIDVAGEIVQIARGSPREIPALLTPEDLQEQRGSREYDDLFDLYPNSVHFVQYITSLYRSDISSELFVRLLDAYHSSKAEKESDPMRVLLYLQMIMQMQSQVSEGSSLQGILGNSEHILQFVIHTLEPSTTTTHVTTSQSKSLGLADLRIVSDDEETFPEDKDSDDEEPGEASASSQDDEITETAINLLLATFEANSSLSARNAPILNDIFTLLEPHASGSSSTIAPLAREARMVMTARLASTSTTWPSPAAKEESPQETYQKALKLLQDPILPVRAHGLLLLRQLVSKHRRASNTTSPDTAALVPAILSIFMQSVQEDDSYIFLNAVQGLAAMVDTFGKEVLTSLLETYTHNLTSIHGGYLTKQEVGTRVRVGEALGQIIRRCGDALAAYADIVVPRLILVFRASQAPTVLRTSAISLLTECIKTSAVALARYINDISAAMIDLVQVEMVPATRASTRDGAMEASDESKKTQPDAEIDSEPASVDPKLPPLRRSALHFFTLLVRTLTQATYEGTNVDLPAASLLRRAKSTLSYISSADEDAIVRVMAREADEGIEQLIKATLGME